MFLFFRFACFFFGKLSLSSTNRIDESILGDNNLNVCHWNSKAKERPKQIKGTNKIELRRWKNCIYYVESYECARARLYWLEWAASNEISRIVGDSLSFKIVWFLVVSPLIRVSLYLQVFLCVLLTFSETKAGRTHNIV